MKDNLTKTQAEILDIFPATADEIALERGYSSTSTVYDHIKGIRGRGVDVGQDVDGRYYEIVPDGGTRSVTGVTNHVEPRRQSIASKATITRKANEFMTELESEIKSVAKEIGPAVAYGGLQNTDGGIDVVIPRSDDHFGDVVKDIDGNVVFNSDIAESRVRSVFDNAIDTIEMRKAMGDTVDTVHVVMHGDHVTNEAIFNSQPWEVDSTIKEQLNRATRVYDDEIERLSGMYPSVQVVCIGGNHGEFRIDGSSNEANADDFLFDRLEMLAVKADYGNVQFVKSDRKDFVNFRMRVDENYDADLAARLGKEIQELTPRERSGWTGHARHGQFVGPHIGTNSRMNDWRGFLIENEFDVAYRGHYHNMKIEHVNGRPVIMNGSIKDAGEYANSIGMFGNPTNYIHGVTDETPLDWAEFLYY